MSYLVDWTIRIQHVNLEGALLMMLPDHAEAMDGLAQRFLNCMHEGFDAGMSAAIGVIDAVMDNYTPSQQEPLRFVRNQLAILQLEIATANVIKS